MQSDLRTRYWATSKLYFLLSQNQDEDDNKRHLSNTSEASIQQRAAAITTKGVAMSFGFKRRTAPSIASNPNAARRLATCDAVGNGGGDCLDGNGNDAADEDSPRDTDSLTGNAAPTGRSTPRLAPPRKEATGARVSRFGFR